MYNRYRKMVRKKIRKGDARRSGRKEREKYIIVGWIAVPIALDDPGE